MLENLRSGLRSALKKMVGASDVNEELIDALCKDVQRALLQSDVNVRLVIDITKRIKDRALNEQPPKGLSRKDHIVSILYSELVRLLGYSQEERDSIPKPGKSEDVTLPISAGINVFLMLGIQGSGKTTVTSKLARWLTKHGYHVGVIGTDTWRPGALTQLKMNCVKINVDVFGDESSKDPAKIVKDGMEYFMKAGVDIVIIDTAGRHKDEFGLLKEMDSMYKISNPNLVLLVIDGTIGQQAFNQAKTFNETTPVGGIIITKLDGTAKGGGALAASAATGAKIFFIGNGERIDDLEQFSPTRFVGRLLGMGDIKALLDMARDLELSGIIKDDQLDVLQNKMEKWRYMIQSMTKEEKNNPDIIHDARRKRIARGCGVMEHDVKDLVKNFNNSKTMMKQSKGRQMHGMLRRLGIG